MDGWMDQSINQSIHQPSELVSPCWMAGWLPKSGSWTDLRPRNAFDIIYHPQVQMQIWSLPDVREGLGPALQSNHGDCSAGRVQSHLLPELGSWKSSDCWIQAAHTHTHIYIYIYTYILPHGSLTSLSIVPALHTLVRLGTRSHLLGKHVPSRGNFPALHFQLSNLPSCPASGLAIAVCSLSEDPGSSDPHQIIALKRQLQSYRFHVSQ